MVSLKLRLALVFALLAGAMVDILNARPRRILVDTDLDVDDIFALIYLLKQNRSEFDVQAITISANAWSDAGHAVNHLYDILFSMDRDDIPIGVGGEGGIWPNGTIDADVGGYLPIIDQGMTTAGGCRYRQAIPMGQRGRLDVNTNYGLRRKLLPQGDRKYTPLRQATAQQVIEAAVSRGPITVILMGSHTNFALFLMTNPHLKKNMEQIFVMGGAIYSDCLKGEPSEPRKWCRIGNLYPPNTNPYAEFNIFADPFAAYKVLHSGIPVTLVPLDATRSIPVDKNFYMDFERRQSTFEAHYCFQSLKMVRDTWINNRFHEEYCLWDSFMVGVALSVMRNRGSHNGENEFAEMEYMNITVVTSNKPFGLLDGSNPLADGLVVPKFNISKHGVHGGHVQTGMQDSFCNAEKQKGKCKDGYTEEVHGEEAVKVLVATKAKPSKDVKSSLKREFYENFLNVVNHPHQSGWFNIGEQFSHQHDVVSKGFPRITSGGKSVVFDMDMSPGDFLALLYLLKAPEDVINLKAILVSSTGWATAATIDLVYDILHMMGRDDIPVGLGEVFAVGQRNPSFSAIGDCQYRKAIPHGSGGLLDSDTLYGLAGYLPRSPRRYTAENSVHFGAPRVTGNPKLRQPVALDVWNSVVESLEPGAKVTLLTNGPLTSSAQILHMENSSSVIQDVFIVGAHIGENNEWGNLFTIPSNKHAEFNMFLDPLAAKAVFDSKLNITIIPLSIQRRVSSFRGMLDKLESKKGTPEAKLARLLLRRLWLLQQHHHRYHHMDIFLGEILGAVTLANSNSQLKETFENSSIKIIADGNESEIGRTVIDEKKGKSVRVLKSIDESLYYEHFARALGLRNSSTKQSYNTNTVEISTGNWRGGQGLIMFLKASCNLWPVHLGVFFFFLCIHIMVFARTRL